MTVLFMFYQLVIFCVAAIVSYKITQLFLKYVYPLIVDKRTTDIEINPKWITTELKENYYGFHNMDIVIVDSPLGMIPRFRLSKDKKKLQLLISEDTSTRDIDDVAQIALSGKLRLYYGVWYPDKPAYWLSILLYMLDGGEIRFNEAKWEKKEKSNV